MAASEITAKYPGKCAACGGTITPGQLILWESRKPSRHKVCPAKPSVPAGVATMTLSFPRRYRPGNEIGRVFRHGKDADAKIVIVLGQKSTEIREDGLSFGLDDDRGWWLELSCREVTAEERAAFETAEKAQQEAEAAARAKAQAEHAAKQAEIATQQQLYRDTVGSLPSTETWAWATLSKREHGIPDDVVARWSTSDRSWARLLRHTAVSGETVFVLQTHDFDDDRDTLFAPQAVIEASWALLREERKVTPAQAEDFLEKYGRCVGADFMHWVLAQPAQAA